MYKNGKCLYEACKLIKRAKRAKRSAVFVVVKYANFCSERRNLLRKSKVLNIAVKVKIQDSRISMSALFKVKVPRQNIWSATKATRNLPWQTPAFFSIYFATMHSGWLHDWVKVTAPIGWFSGGVCSRNLTSDTFLEHCMMPLVHAHCMQEPTDHLAPSKYWLPSSSWHVTS